MWGRIKGFFKRCFGKSKCPYCKEKCITAYTRSNAGQLFVIAECPRCGAELKIEKRLFAVGNILQLSAIAMYIIIMVCADFLIGKGFCEFVLLSALFISRFVIPTYGKMEYEEDWKHPKPSEEEEQGKTV